MNRVFVACYLLIGMALSGGSAADDSAADYEEYSKTRDIAVELYVLGFQKFGNRLRSSAILHACNKAGVAKTVDVEAFEGVQFLRKEMGRLRLGNSVGAKILDSLTTKEKMNLLLAVNDQLIAYKLGYTDAIAALKDNAPAVCEVGMQMADKILKERK